MHSGGTGGLGVFGGSHDVVVMMSWDSSFVKWIVGLGGDSSPDAIIAGSTDEMDQFFTPSTEPSAAFSTWGPVIKAKDSRFRLRREDGTFKITHLVYVPEGSSRHVHVPLPQLQTSPRCSLPSVRCRVTCCMQLWMNFLWNTSMDASSSSYDEADINRTISLKKIRPNFASNPVGRPASRPQQQRSDSIFQWIITNQFTHIFYSISKFMNPICTWWDQGSEGLERQATLLITRAAAFILNSLFWPFAEQKF